MTLADAHEAYRDALRRCNDVYRRVREMASFDSTNPSDPRTPRELTIARIVRDRAWHTYLREGGR